MNNRTSRCRRSAVMMPWPSRRRSTVRITPFMQGRSFTNILGGCRAKRPLTAAGRHCVSTDKRRASSGWQRLQHGLRNLSGRKLSSSRPCSVGPVRQSALPRSSYHLVIMTKSSRRHLRRSAQKILVPTDGHTQIRINQSGWQEIKILLRRSTSMSLVGTNRANGTGLLMSDVGG